MVDPKREPTPLRLPCSCGVVVEAGTDVDLLTAVEAHIAAAHGRGWTSAAFPGRRDRPATTVDERT